MFLNVVGDLEEVFVVFLVWYRVLYVIERMLGCCDCIVEVGRIGLGYFGEWFFVGWVDCFDCFVGVVVELVVDEDLVVFFELCDVV